MISVRVIPSLLLDGVGLVKTTKFSKPKYVGDPINAIKIFNDKEVDELVVLDIGASRKNKKPNYDLLNRINKEAFMPLGYGGGINKSDEVARVLELGYEKVIINSSALDDVKIIKEATMLCGSSSVVTCIDVKKNIFKDYKVYNHRLRKNTKLEPLEWAKTIQDNGAGEIIIHFVDREGTYSGYDNLFLRSITDALDIPVIALGGAGNTKDFKDAVNIGKVSAVAAGNMFIYQRPHNAVLISYPERSVLEEIFNKNRDTNDKK